MNDFLFHFTYDDEDKRLSLYYAKQRDIDEFDFTQYDIQILSIAGDYFHTLRVPNGVQELILSNVALRELYLPDSVKIAYIDHNKLEYLEIPPGIERLIADHNILKRIEVRGNAVPKNLTTIDLESNRLTNLPFEPTESLYEINIWNNYIKELSEEWKQFISTSDCCYWCEPPSDFFR